MNSNKLPHSSMHQQKGVVLILSIIMVLVISVAAVSTVDMSQVNQTMIRNQQETLRAEQVASDVIEELLDSTTRFEEAGAAQKALKAAGNPVAAYTPPDISYDRDGFNVTVLDIRCSYSHKISGYSLTTTSVPETNYFEIDLAVEDTATNVVTRMTQGIKFNYPADLCFDS